MSFARPDLLWLAFALPALAALAVAGWARRRRRAARALGDAALVARLGLADANGFAVRRLLLLALAAVSLGLAAAGPRWGTRVSETRTRASSIVLALDVSKSMLARDLEPDRLERQRLLVRRLLRELPGDRMGLIAFAGRAYVLTPLTVDRGALELYLDALDPGIVSQGGSSLASALDQSVALLRGQTVSPGERAVVLVTDGEALEDEDAVRSAAERAARAGVTVHTVGVGTPDGAPVPEPDPLTGEPAGYKRDLSGQIVISKLNEPLLRDVARATGGRFVRLDQAGATGRLLAELRGLERRGVRADRRLVPIERYAWFVGLALGLLALDAVLARRRQGRPAGPGAGPGEAPVTRPGTSAAASVGAAAASLGVAAISGGVAAAARMVLALVLLASITALGIGDAERGNRLYRQGRYAEAVEAYREALEGGSGSPELRYNLGTALLRLGRYDEAERELRAALAGVDPELRERAYYNLGNRYLEAGRRAANPQDRARLLDAAVDAYKRALRLDPADADAKWNLELALRDREEQPPPPTPQSGGSQDPRDDGEQDEGDQPQGSGGQDDPAPTRPDEPRPDRPPGAAAPMDRAQAERILSAVEQDERELFRQKLRKGRRETPVARDW